MADLQKLVVRLEAETAKYQRDLDSARKKLSAFEKGASASIAKVASGFAGLVSATAVLAFVKKTVEAGDRLDELAQKTGVTVESLSRLGYAASFSGIGVEELADSLGKFAKASIAAEHDGKAQAAAFDAIGISVEELAGLSPDEKLLKVAEAFSQLEDGQGKAAVAMALFGKSGADLIPFLNEGPDGIARLAQESDELGQTMSGETAKALADFADGTDKLFTAISASLRPAVVELIGPLDELANILLDDAKQAGVADKDFSVLAVTLQTAASAALAFYTALVLIKNLGSGAISTGISTFVGGMTDGAQSAAAAVDQTAADLEKAVKRLDAIWANRSSTGGGKDMGVLNPYAETVFEGETPLKRRRIDFDPTGGGEDKAGKAAERAAKALQSKIAALEQEAATLGQSSAQQQLYELRLEGATDAQLAHAQALVTTIGNYELQQEAKDDLAAEDERLTSLSREYMSILDELDGGTRKYGDALAELDVLVKAGNISLEQRTQIAGELEKQMKGLKDASDFADEAYQSIRGSTKNLFSDLLTDGKNWKDHLIGYLENIGDAFADMAADMATQALFGGTGSGGGGFNWGGLIGGLIGSLGGMFGGGGGFGGGIGTSLANTGISFTGVQLAEGGWTPRGGWSLVGEEGPELIYTHNPARVFSNDDSADMFSGAGRSAPTVNFNVYTPNPDGFRASEKQMTRRARATLGM